MSEPPPWQVVTLWVNEVGRESVRIGGFLSYEEARLEVRRLAAFLGELVGDVILKSVELAGNFKTVWCQLKQ